MSLSSLPETHVRVYYRGNKYDVPISFATRLHPGGTDILRRYKDRDITKDFDKVEHSMDALEILSEWQVDGPYDGRICKEVPLIAAEQEGKVMSHREDEKAASKHWNRMAILFGLASIVAAVHVRKHWIEEKG